MMNEQINENFFRACLKDEIADVTNFKTLIHHDVQFVDPDYHQFMYGMLWSAEVNQKKAYFYVVLKIGDELADVFFKSVINEIVINKISAWHKEKFPHEPQEPMVECIVFRCPRKKVNDDKLP